MKFKSEKHKEVYLKAMSRTRYPSTDCYRKALFYTLGIIGDMAVIDRCYDWEEECVKPDSIYDGWQTGSSRRLTRLAFNLFNCGVPTAYIQKTKDDKISELLNNTPIEIFSNYEDMEYMFEAIRIRFEIV